MRQAKIENGVVTQVIRATNEEALVLGGEWIDVTGTAVSIKDLYDGNVFSPAPYVPRYRTLLTAEEFVDSWSSAEWRSLKNLAAGTGNVAEKLDQLLDAIKLTNSFDVNGTKAGQFYGYLVTQAFITQARADELQLGIEV